jgi:beta-lactamase regulating signal transducer with metallopeptidase domain
MTAFNSSLELAGMSWLVVWALTATAVWGAATAIAACLRRHSAHARHRVWAISMLIFLLAPVLAPALPVPRWWNWAVEGNSVQLAQTPPAADHRSGHGSVHEDANRSFTGGPADDRPNTNERRVSDELPSAPVSTAPRRPANLARAESAPARAFSWRSALVAIWLAGSAVSVLMLAFGMWRVRRMRVLAAKVTGETETVLCRELCRTLGIRCDVALLVAPQASVPLLAGVIRPAIILPTGFGRWSADRLRVVLTHELIHLKRRDVWWEIIAQLAKAPTWFHPLAWYAVRRLRIERELACDDAVIASGAQPADYAEQLVEVAGELRSASWRPAPVVAIAGASPIERRVRSILNPRTWRTPLSRWRTLALATFMASLVIIVAAFSPASGDNQPVNQVAATDQGVQRAAKTAAMETTRELPSIRVRILDRDGNPLPDAGVHASIWTEEKPFKANRDYTTDSHGFAEVELPRSYYIVRLWASKRPFVTMFSHWEQSELAGGKRLPAEYTIHLERGVKAGGLIVNERGQPIAGAKVQVSTSGGTPAKGDGRTSYDAWLATGNDAATTDSDGKWHIENVPDHAQATLSLLVTHPAYSSDESWGQSQKDSGVTTEMLRQETPSITLKDGNIVNGRVTDPDRHPIKDAVVVLGDDPYFSSVQAEFPTDADGRFRLPTQSSKLTSLTVIAPGFAPQLRRIEIKKGLPPQDFKMEPGKTAEIRFVDTSGKPVPYVYANVLSWKGSKSVFYQHNPNQPKVPDTKIPNKADANGVWRWNSAPDGPVTLEIYAKGFARIEVTIAGGDSPKTVTLRPEHLITGHVIDARTKQPVPVFTVIPINVFRPDWLDSERGNAETGKNGKLDYLATRTDIPLRLRIEAMGYRTQTGPEFRVGDDSPRTQDFEMQPSKPVVGQVIDSAGHPVANVVVLLATPTTDARLQSDYAWGNN